MTRQEQVIQISEDEASSSCNNSSNSRSESINGLQLLNGQEQCLAPFMQVEIRHVL